MARPGRSRWVLWAVLASTAHGAQWTVDDDGPADFPSVRAAVNAPYVLSGDTILVRPGRYVGLVTLSTKDLAIVAEAGPFFTILDAERQGSVVSLEGRSAATRIEGFTLTGGQSDVGGGVWIFGGAPVITRNVIVGNEAIGGYLGYGYGGGIEVYSAAPTITHNVIRENSALDGGGGIDVYYAGPSTPDTCCPLIERNTIADNVVTSPSGRGGGVLVFASGPTIRASILVGNRAAAGGGLFVEKVQGTADMPDVTNGIVFANVPDASDSNGAWRLPSTNREIDPRLAPGPGGTAWPRSDSPALDVLAGATTIVDLTGLPAMVDSNLDGIAAADVGAIEGRGEITDLRLARHASWPWASVLVWDGLVSATAHYHVLRDTPGPFNSQGDLCLAAVAATTWVDTEAPADGVAFFYLVVGHHAVVGSAGARSDGTPRPVAGACSGE